jgi:hypothetical protein
MLVFPTVEPKIAIESRIPKELPKIPTLFPEAASKMVRKIVQSCSPKLLPNVASKAVPQSYSPKLLSPSCDSANLFAKTAPQNYSTKQLPKATPQRVHAKETSTVCAVEGGCGKRAISQRYIIERSPLIDG